MGRHGWGHPWSRRCRCAGCVRNVKCASAGTGAATHPVAEACSPSVAARARRHFPSGGRTQRMDQGINVGSAEQFRVQPAMGVPEWHRGLSRLGSQGAMHEANRLFRVINPHCGTVYNNSMAPAVLAGVGVCPASMPTATHAPPLQCTAKNELAASPLPSSIEYAHQQPQAATGSSGAALGRLTATAWG